jgi:hypothetical protein
MDDKEDHGVSGDKQQPQKKHCQIVDNSDNSDSQGPSQRDSDMRAESSSRKVGFKYNSTSV